MPKRKLLLADDSITIQKVVNLTFADEGIEVVAVGDGDAAMDKLREDSPDIVLADVNMPGLTGYEICAEVKARAFADQVPVVLLVGSFEPFDEEEADRVGADGYLTKPFQSISQLVSKVSDLLGIEPAPDPEFEDTAEFVETLPEPVSTSVDTGAEPGTPSFPDPLQGMMKRQESIDPPYEPSEATAPLSGFGDFNDADEFEMSEAFGDDESIEEIEPGSRDDSQIEEVTEDFLKTQPFTESDLQEIAIDDENTEASEPEATLRPVETIDTEPFAFGDSSGEFNDESDVPEEPVFRIESTDEFEPETRFGVKDEFEAETGEDDTAASRFEEQPQLESVGGGDADESNPFMDTFEQEVQFSAAEEAEFESTSEFRDIDEFVSESPLGSIGELESESIEADSFDEFEGWADDETIEESELPQPEGASVLDLDEMNLLELPPVDKDDQDFEDAEDSEDADHVEKGFDIASPRFVADVETPGPEAFADSVEAVSESPEEPEVHEFTENVESRPATEVRNTDAAVPSKEMVEAVTRQVIQTLSEKAIREIAWEVVPDLADLIIKKMAEEKMRE